MLTSIIAVALLLVAGASSQGIDPTFCSFATTISPQIPFPIPSLTFDYQTSIEVNSELTKTTVEMDQYYDGFRNRAVTFYRTKELEIKTYTYGDSNELLVVTGTGCKAFKANETTDIGVGAMNFNGTEHIIPPLALLHYQNPDIKEVFIGEFVRRGIKVIAWQSCFYNDKIKGTQKRTYYLSNPIDWSIAVPIGNNTAVPVEITIDTKLQNGTEWRDTYVFTKFRPGNVFVENEFWLTPRGVWCAGRQAGPTPPTVPKVFSFRSTIVSPFPNLNGIIGVTTNIRESYDFPRKLVRFDMVKNNFPLSEIHDFNTGLRYIIDKFRGNCTLSILDPDGFDAENNGTSIKLKDPQAFFNLADGDVQYTGQRFTQGIETDVWIARRVKNNITATWEWYFMAEGWTHEGSLNWQKRELVQINVVYYQPYIRNDTQQLDYGKIPITYLVSDYDDSGVNFYDFDISRCTDKLPKKHFKFNLPVDYYDIMESNKVIMQISILAELESYSKLPTIRISQLKVDFNSDSIFVVFTLLEKNANSGPVETKDEISLEDAIKALNESITKIKIKIPVDNTTILQIPILADSFYEIETRETVFVINKEITKNKGYTSGTVAGISIVLLFVGVLLGVLAGIYFCIYKPNSIPMDKLNKLAEGFTNINFKNSA